MTGSAPLLRSDDWIRKWIPLSLAVLGWVFSLGYLVRGVKINATLTEQQAIQIRAMELEQAEWRSAIIRLAAMGDDVVEIKEALAEERGRRGQ